MHQPRRLRPRIAAAAAVAALVLLAWWALKPAGDGEERGGRGGRPVSVVTAPAARKDMRIFLDGLGTVQAYRTVTVRSRVDGQLVEVAFKEGQDVQAGQVLARIDQRTYKAAYDQAVAQRDRDAAQLDGARRDLERFVSLGNRVTGQSVDNQRTLVRQLEATVRADQAAVENAAAMLAYTTITAPFAGRTGLRQVDEGNQIRASDATGLVVLTQLEPIAVVFTLPQQSLPQVLNAEKDAEGKVTVIAMAQGGQAEIDRGTLELVDNQIDTATGTYKLKAVMPNARRQLWPGGFVQVRLLAATRNGVVVPANAVQRGPQGPYVFVVGEDRTAEVRPVRTAASEANETLIEDGLKEGERVVVDGGIKLQHGSKVTEGGDGKGGGEGKGNGGKDGKKAGK